MAIPNQKRRLALFIIAISFLFTTRRVNSSYTDDRGPFIPGAVAYWPMTSETQGLDFSGNGNNATFVGLTYSDGPSGEPNSAVHFHGNPNSHILVNNSLSMQVGKYPGFSFTGFVRFATDQHDVSLIDWSSQGKNGLYIMAQPKKNVLLKLSPSDGTIKYSVDFPNMKFTKGLWQFFGISYSKTTGMVTAFIDGVQEQKSIGKNINAGTYAGSEVGIGIPLLYRKEFNYNGDMSCVMLFQVALTADDFERVKRFCSTVTTPKRTTLPDITLSELAETGAIASWTVSPGIFSGYCIRIERKESELDIESVHPPFIPLSVKFPMSLLANLVPGATYRVHVSHMQGKLVGRERSSKWFNAKSYRPPVVESHSILFFNITATSAEVSWKNVTGNFSGYFVEISPSTGGAKAYPSTVPREKNTTSLKNLFPGTHYTIKIRAVKGRKLTSSSTRSFQTRELTPVESGSISISDITTTSAEVTWKDASGDFDGYSVEISPKAGGAKAHPSTVRRGINTASLKNLSPGSFYIITIRIKLGSRTSSPSMQSFQTLDLAKSDPPSLRVITGIASAAFGWAVICFFITSFRLLRRYFKWDTLRRTFCRSAMKGKKGDDIEFNLTKDELVKVKSGSINISAITATSAEVTWNDVTGDFDGYSVEISPTDGGTYVDPNTVPRGTTRTTLKILSPGITYTIEIKTKRDSKMSSPSTKSFQMRVPVESGSIKFASIKSTSAEVNWEEVTDDFDGYSVEISPTEGGAIVDSRWIPKGTTSTTLKNLSPGIQYTIEIKTKSGEVTSLPSKASFRTREIDPVESRSIEFASITATSAVVNWKDVTCDFDGYSVEISPTEDGANVDPCWVPRGKTTTSLKNLSPDIKYTIAIKTTFGKGKSSPSMASFKTRGLDQVESRSIKFPMITPTSAEVKWKGVTCYVDGYSVEISPKEDGANVDPSWVPKGKTTTTYLKNLSPGIQYTIEIKTKSGLVTSLPSKASFETRELDLTTNWAEKTSKGNGRRMSDPPHYSGEGSALPPKTPTEKESDEESDSEETLCHHISWSKI